MVELPAKIKLLDNDPTAPVHVPPVRTIVVVPVKEAVVVSPPVCQWKFPSMTQAAVTVVNPLMVTAATMVIVNPPGMLHVPAEISKAPANVRVVLLEIVKSPVLTNALPSVIVTVIPPMVILFHVTADAFTPAVRFKLRVEPVVVIEPDEYNNVPVL